MASSGVDITLIGDKQLIKLFKTLPDKLQKKFAVQALRAEAKLVKGEIQAATPVLTGRLKKSMKVKSVKRSRVKIGVKIETGTRAELGIPPDSKWYYPAHVELGTRTRPAKSFMRKTVHRTRARHQQNIGKQIVTAIEREARRVVNK